MSATPTSPIAIHDKKPATNQNKPDIAHPIGSRLSSLEKSSLRRPMCHARHSQNPTHCSVLLSRRVHGGQPEAKTALRVKTGPASLPAEQDGSGTRAGSREQG